MKTRSQFVFMEDREFDIILAVKRDEEAMMISLGYKRIPTSHLPVAVRLELKARAVYGSRHDDVC